MSRPIILIAVVGLAIATLQADPSPQKTNDSQIAKLIKQLGDSSFQVRTAAYKGLQLLGPEALPLLREAIKQNTDPEVRRRLEEIVPGLEKAAALAPTRITIKMENKPVRDAVKELARQSGYKVDLWPPGGTDERERRVMNFDLKNVTFWEALYQTCELGGLWWHEDWDGTNMSFRLQFQDNHPGIVSLSGAFRISVYSFDYHRNLYLTGGPRQNPEGPFRRNETLQVGLMVAVEPKLPLLGAGQPTLTEALDDQNQSLLLPAQNRNAFENWGGGGYRMHQQHVQAQLSPSKGGKRVASLKGTVPVLVVASQKPKITVDKILTVKNKTFKSGNTTMVIDHAARNGDQITVKMSMTEKPAKGVQDYTWMNSLAQRLEVIDSKGTKFRSWGPREANWGNNNVDGTFMFGRDGGIMRPVLPFGALFGAGKQKDESIKLVYYEWATLTHAIPFEFKDLPLP